MGLSKLRFSRNAAAVTPLCEKRNERKGEKNQVIQHDQRECRLQANNTRGYNHSPGHSETAQQQGQQQRQEGREGLRRGDRNLLHDAQNVFQVFGPVVLQNINNGGQVRGDVLSGDGDQLGQLEQNGLAETRARATNNLKRKQV